MSSAFGQMVAYLKKYSKVKFSFLYCALHKPLSHCSNTAKRRGLHPECHWRENCCVFICTVSSHSVPIAV